MVNSWKTRSINQSKNTNMLARIGELHRLWEKAAGGRWDKLQNLNIFLGKVWDSSLHQGSVLQADGALFRFSSCCADQVCSVVCHTLILRKESFRSGIFPTWCLFLMAWHIVLMGKSCGDRNKAVLMRSQMMFRNYMKMYKRGEAFRKEH